MKKIYAAAAQKKIADSLLSIAEQQITHLQNTIMLLNKKDVELKAMYERQLKDLKEQTAIYNDQIFGYEKLLKQEKRKRRWIAAAGIAATGVMTYFYLTK